MSVFVDIHVLQTLPPSNPNRDDTGAPKTATFGGSHRRLLSGQFGRILKSLLRNRFREFVRREFPLFSRARF